LHPASKRNFPAEVQDDGVPSSFVLGMTLARKKLLFPPTISFLLLSNSPLSWERGWGRGFLQN